MGTNPLGLVRRETLVEQAAIMAEEGAGAAGGVMHCFTETAEVAREAIAQRLRPLLDTREGERW